MSHVAQWIRQLSQKTQRCLYTIQLDGVDLLRQLKFEEFLYRKVAPVAEGCAFFLVNNHRRTGSRAVVMGFSGNERDFVKDPEETKARGVSIIRRFTGGGTVIVDECSLNTSLIASTQIAKNMSPNLICNWSYDNVFKDCGIFSDRFAVVEGDFVVKDVRKMQSCEQGAREPTEDSSHSYYKVAGNSQAFNHLAFVHHSVFLWSMSPLISQILLHPKKTPNYRDGRDHMSFLRSIREALDTNCNVSTIDDFERALCNRGAKNLLEKMNRKVHVIVSATAEEDGDILQSLHRNSVLLSDKLIDDAIAMLHRPVTEVV